MAVPAERPRATSAWDARFCAFAQTLAGRVALVLIFTAMLKATRVSAWWETGIVLLLISVFPTHRKTLVTLAAIAWVFIAPPLLINALYPNQAFALAQRHGAESWTRFWPGTHIGAGLPPMLVANLGLAVIVGAVLLFAYGYVRMVRAYPKSLVGKWPISGLIVLMLALLWVQQYLSGFAWFAVASFELVLGHYIWFFAYTLSEPRTTNGKPTPVQPGYWRYFWAVNKCPMGKGAQYLDRAEAKNDEELAATQLSGMKLMLWVLCLTVLRIVIKQWLYGPRSESLTTIPGWHPPGWLPLYNDALDRAIAGDPYPFAIRWAVLIGQFVYLLLDLSIWAHKLVAIARMAGYNIFRNMYRPLEATSVADFYNRFHWYFKEMLVTFFFFPTYLRFFRKSPRLRIFVATLVAVGWGNFIYHFLHYDRSIYEYGLWPALVNYHAYAVYTLLLALGIAVSQLRSHGVKQEQPTVLRRMGMLMSVLLFFLLISVIDEGANIRSIADYWFYWKSLFIP